MSRFALWIRTREYRLIVMLYLEHRNAKLLMRKQREPV